MSKQSEAKEAQGYRKEGPTCATCAHFTKDTVEKSYDGFSGAMTWTVDKNLRCGIGGFAVQKRGYCWRHSWRED